MRRLLLSSVVFCSVSALAQRPPPAPTPAPTPAAAPVAMVAPAPPAPPAPPMGFGLHSPPGIPPQIAQKLGISPDTVKKVRDFGFEANDAVISLEADLKRAQLDLERTLSQTTVDEGAVMGKLDAVGRAELAIRKNRMGLMLRIRKLLGPDLWERLQAEMQSNDGPGANMMMLAPGPGVHRREVRIINRGDGTSNVTETNE